MFLMEGCQPCVPTAPNGWRKCRSGALGLRKVVHIAVTSAYMIVIYPALPVLRFGYDSPPDPFTLKQKRAGRKCENNVMKGVKRCEIQEAGHRTFVQGIQSPPQQTESSAINLCQRALLILSLALTNMYLVFPLRFLD